METIKEIFMRNVSLKYFTIKYIDIRHFSFDSFVHFRGKLRFMLMEKKFSILGKEEVSESWHSFTGHPERQRLRLQQMSNFGVLTG